MAFMGREFTSGGQESGRVFGAAVQNIPKEVLHRASTTSVKG